MEASLAVYEDVVSLLSASEEVTLSFNIRQEPGNTGAILSVAVGNDR